MTTPTTSEEFLDMVYGAAISDTPKEKGKPWLTPTGVANLYNQKANSRGYWIDRVGEFHFMSDMSTTYLCNVIRFVGRSNHLRGAWYGMVRTRLFAFEAGPESDWERGLEQEFEAEIDELTDMMKAKWDTPLVQQLRRHIEARAWRVQEAQLGS